MIGSVTQIRQEMAEIAKRQRRKDRPVRDQPAAAEPEVHTGAHDVAEGHRRAMADDAAGKAYRPLPDPAAPVQQPEVFAQDYRRPYEDQGHGAESPQSEPPCGYPVTEGQPQPGAFGRGYINAGHAAESRQARPSPANPVHHAPPGMLRPVVLPDAPMAAPIPPHVAASWSTGSPSDR
jgi:hypothetical protein